MDTDNEYQGIDGSLDAQRDTIRHRSTQLPAMSVWRCVMLASTSPSL